jgi:hypothetical protein
VDAKMNHTYQTPVRCSRVQRARPSARTAASEDVAASAAMKTKPRPPPRVPESGWRAGHP